MVNQLENHTVLESADVTDCGKGDSKRANPIIDKCPECKSLNLIHDYDTGEIVCGDCGLVLHEQMTDRGPEWRAYTQEEKASRSRVGMPTQYSVHNKGLSTNIGQDGYDASGRKLSLSTKLQMGRLRKWQKHLSVYSSLERNLAQAMAELDRIVDNENLTIPKPIKEKAAVIYRKAVDKGLTRGRSIVAVVAAALYAACRSTGTPRTLNEISKASLTGKKEVARCYRLLLNELDMKMPINDPVLCVSKIAERVGISGKTQGVAINILREAKRKRIRAGKNPMGLAGAALYIAGLQNNDKGTQKDIAEACGVTEVTIRNRMKTLVKGLNLILPSH